MADDYRAPMTLPPGHHELGPDRGRVRIRTARQGVAARAGHDLLIEFTRWTGRLVLNEPPYVTALIELDSLQVVEGTGGALPLTDRDRREIAATARRLLDVDTHPTAHFESSWAIRTDAGATVEGTLIVRGEPAPVTIEVRDTGPASWRGIATVRHSAYGIAPYRAFLGALRLADEIRIEVDIELPTTLL